MIRFGSKEHTIETYKQLRFEMNAQTTTIIEFFEWLKKEGKLHHLKDCKYLTSLESAIIEEMLSK